MGLKEGGWGKATETVEAGENFVKYYWKARPGEFRGRGYLGDAYRGEEGGIGTGNGDED